MLAVCGNSALKFYFVDLDINLLHTKVNVICKHRSHVFASEKNRHF